MIRHWGLDALTKCLTVSKRFWKFLYHFCLPLERQKKEWKKKKKKKNSRSTPQLIRKKLLANNFPRVGTHDLGVSSTFPQYLLLDQTNQVCKVVRPERVCAFNLYLSDLLKLKLVLNVYKHKHKHTHKISYSKSMYFQGHLFLKNQQYLKPPRFCMSLVRYLLALSVCCDVSLYFCLSPWLCAPPPTPPQPDVRPFSSLSLLFTCYPQRRQRQKRVGMKTPNATSIGNIRLLLSAAYGLGVRGPDRTGFFGAVEALFFSPSTPSPSSSSSSSSSLFSSPGCGCSFGTSEK